MPAKTDRTLHRIEIIYDFLQCNTSLSIVLLSVFYDILQK